MLILKDKEAAYLALPADSILCSGVGDDEWDLAEENLQVWKVPNDDGIIVAAGGCGFVSDAFRYDPDFIRGELTMDNIILEVVPKLKSVLGKYGKLDEDGDIRSTFGFAQKNRAFFLSGVFQATEIDDSHARLGSGFSYGFSAFRLTKGLPAEERLLFAANIIGKATRAARTPLAVINTKTCKPYLIGERKF